MAGTGIEQRVLAALEEGAPGQGLDIVSVELSGPQDHPTLRVRVDLLEGGPIDMNRVTAATPWVSEVVEALDPFAGAWELEVSSPGIDRPLRRPSDFAARVGERVEVATSEPVEGRKSFTGMVASVGEGAVALDVDGAAFEIPFELVRQAKLKPDFEVIMAAAKKADKEAAKEAKEAKKAARAAKKGGKAAPAAPDSDTEAPEEPAGSEDE